MGQQYGLKAGFKRFGWKGKHAVKLELYQLHDMGTFSPLRANKVVKKDRVWEYTGFGTTIGLLNPWAGDFPNSVLYDEWCKLTRKHITVSFSYIRYVAHCWRSNSCCT